MATRATLSLNDIKGMTKVALTRAEAARAMGVDPRTVTAGIENGTIPSVKLGRRVLIPRITFLAVFGVEVD